MPSTFTGLVIFLALLAPGFTYILICERGLTAVRTTSALRETATISLASLIFDVLAFGFCLIVAAVTPLPAPSLAKLLTGGLKYVAQAPAKTTIWFIACLALACLLAAAAGGAYNRTSQFSALRARKPFVWLLPASGGNKQVSGWWAILVDREFLPDYARVVTCYLEDGSSVAGAVFRVNGDATEGPERDLALSAPLRVVDKTSSVRVITVGSAVVSAARILYMHVTYVTPNVAADGTWMPQEDLQPRAQPDRSTGAQARRPADDPADKVSK